MHAARRYTQSMRGGQLFVKIDFEKTFNTVCRDVILEAVTKHFPELLPYTTSAYEHGSNLRFGSFLVQLKEGVQQGDPLGPLLFCFAIWELLFSLKSELTLDYLDHVAIGDNTLTVLNDFLFIEKEAAALGLRLNRCKCKVTGHTTESRRLFLDSSVFLKETKLIDLILVGSPHH